MTELEFRPWQDRDDLNLNELWGDAPSPSASAARALFRPESDTPVVRTLVAEREGIPVAAGYIVEASIHPGRAWAYVEVATQERRAGVGTALLTALREAVAGTRIDGLPLRAKVAPGAAGEAFAQAAGFRTLQRSRMVQLEAGALPAPDVDEARDAALHIEVVATGSVELTTALWDWYAAAHQDWDPAANPGIGRVNAMFLGEASGARAAAILRRNGKLRAFAISYAEEGDESPAELLVGTSVAEGAEGGSDDVRALIGQLIVDHPVEVEVDDSLGSVAEVVDEVVAAGKGRVVSETLVIGT
ncbi:GNAT family N-acetyltransferase [Saxibacter everestensis]|uniref:GNAT family N-acetyltransferase n=1 Tax=Saxibacter everestensis TaxID=2909229 RepID=A0ABY8QVB6_9MICO|nr:GNAT family N-acetyltransferase [Brevibacteriaceae bacterium ZFBP1038]